MSTKPLGASLPAQLVISKDATTDSFPWDKPVVELDENISIDQALRTLAKAGVCSAPVYSATKRDYLGFCDLLDLIALAVDSMDLLTMLHLKPDDTGHMQSIPEDTQSSDIMLKRQKTAISHKTLAEMFAASEARFGQAQWHPVFEGTSFREVLKLLAHKCRRVAVLSLSTKRVVKIISQGAVVDMLYEHMRKMGDTVPETPKNTGWGIKPVFSVGEDNSAREAFKMMVEHGISAVAVLDGAGKLLSTITTKDIRLLTSVEFQGKQLLDLSVREYISRIRRLDKTYAERPSIIASGLNTSLTTIIGKIAATKTHRIFIENEQGKCVGVVSVTDCVLLLERGNHFG